MASLLAVFLTFYGFSSVIDVPVGIVGDNVTLSLPLFTCSNPNSVRATVIYFDNEDKTIDLYSLFQKLSMLCSAEQRTCQLPSPDIQRTSVTTTESKDIAMFQVELPKHAQVSYF